MWDTQYFLNINKLFHNTCEIKHKSVWREKLDLHTFPFGYHITQNAFIAASVKLHSLHSRIIITIISHSRLLHFGSLHLSFKDFLEKKRTQFVE